VIQNPAGGYMLTLSSGFAFHSFEVYSYTDSSQPTGDSPEVSNVDRWLFLKLNCQFICNLTNRRFSARTEPAWMLPANPGIAASKEGRDFWNFCLLF
jgi:hypothetical protein